MKQEFTLTIEIYIEDNQKRVFIAEDNSTGVDYIVNTNTIGDCVDNYIENYHSKERSKYEY